MKERFLLLALIVLVACLVGIGAILIVMELR